MKDTATPSSSDVVYILGHFFGSSLPHEMLTGANFFGEFSNLSSETSALRVTVPLQIFTYFPLRLLAKVSVKLLKIIILSGKFTYPTEYNRSDRSAFTPAL